MKLFAKIKEYYNEWNDFRDSTKYTKVWDNGKYVKILRSEHDRSIKERHASLTQKKVSGTTRNRNNSFVNDVPTGERTWAINQILHDIATKYGKNGLISIDDAIKFVNQDNGYDWSNKVGLSSYTNIYNKQNPGKEMVHFLPKKLNGRARSAKYTHILACRLSK